MVKKKKEIISLDRNNLLAQPVTLSMLPYQAGLNQIKVINAVVRQLQGIFNDKIKEKRSNAPVQVSLFDSPEFRTKYMGEKDIVFDLHLSELGIAPKHYPLAFNTIFQMAGIQCLVPVDNGQGETGFMVDTLLKPVIWTKNIITETNEKGETVYKYKKPIVTIVIKEYVAKYVFDLNKWIDHYLDYTVTNSESSYSARIYIYISSKYSRDGSKFREDYNSFRKIMGFIDDNESKYMYFSDFKRRVLDPAKKELEKKAKTKETDFYFDYKPVYKNNRKSRCPESIEFDIKLSELGNQLQNDKNVIKEEIALEKKLKEKLQQTSTQTKSLMAKVLPANLKKFAQKVESLINDIESGKYEITTSVRRYANKSLTTFIETELVEEEIPLEILPLKSIHEPAAIAPKAVFNSQLDDKQRKSWNKFLDLIKEQISLEQYEIWFKDFIPYAIKKEDEYTKITVIVPTPFFYEYIEEKYIKEMKSALHKVYGEKTQLFYNIGVGAW